MRSRPNAISGQFAPRMIEMLESPAYRVLSLSAHRALARIEIEHGHHGGKENGKLPVTYADFQSYGIDRDAIAPALRELVALGFVEITLPGCAGNAQYRRPNHFRLTFRDAKGTRGDGTHEWREIGDLMDAKAKASVARATPTDRQFSTRKKRSLRSAIPRQKIKAQTNNPDSM